MVLQKIHEVIKFNQEVWLKPNIDMNRNLRAKEKNDFQKLLFQVVEYLSFWKNFRNCKYSRGCGTCNN